MVPWEEIAAEWEAVKRLGSGEWSNPHNDAHRWGVWKDDVAGAVRYCLDCDETDFRPEG